MTANAPSPDPAPRPAGLDATDAPARIEFPVVGIGGSAGALIALRNLFEALPPAPDMAFVVVVHLSPDFESHLADILARSTPMPVQQVTETTRIERDHVYVISPKLDLTMVDRELRVTPMDRHGGPNTAVDIFLRTLGDRHRERSVGIVLSGMGSGGALGLRRIKERGGVTFVQSPGDAEFDSMPVSSIAEGAVDFVAPAAEIGRRLLDLWANARRIELPHPAQQEVAVASPATPAAAVAAEQALAQILDVLRERTGHDFTHYKPATVLRRLERRLQVTEMPNLPAYSHHLHGNFGETAALLKDLLISVTNYFSDAEAFAALEVAIDKTVFGAAAGAKRVRAWVAGCATGEEAYSLGMLLVEAASKHSSMPEINVFASDIDERAIAVARAGLYPEAIAADFSATRLKDFFEREGAHVRVRKSLCEKILFASHNLLRDPPFSNLDVVSCRNLLIYFDRQMQEQVLQVLHFALRPGGLLFLGSAESAESAGDLFSIVDKKHHLYRAEPVPRARRAPLPTMPWNVRIGQQGTPSGVVATTPAPPGVPAALHDQLRFVHAPASVLIDGTYDLLHSNLQSEAYLRFSPGIPSQNLLDLVRPELAVELRTALFMAWKERTSVEARRVQVQQEGATLWVTMTVRYAAHDGVGYLLVTFDSVQRTLVPLTSTRGRKDPAVTMLEAELERTREDLRGSLGDSAASNEELQSSNEELCSTTEELETSKEELQSLNEELITVNHELKAKVEEARLMYDDLGNLIASTDIATVFVDRAMRIKRFTPRAAQLFNLIATDIGRSLLHITHSLNYDRLEADATEAFETLRVAEREVRGRDGNFYLVRALPCRTRQNVIDGAVLTFVDISVTRRAEEAARIGEANLRLLVESTKDFAIITMDTAGAVTSWNEGAQRLFGFAGAEIVGASIDVIFTVADRAAGASQRERQLARDEGRAADERWHLRSDGSTFFCSGIMTPMREHGRLVGFAKIARDLTDSKRAEIQLGAALEKETDVRAELQRAIAMKDEFLAVMSHELKHPLNLIHVNAELLSRLPESRDLPAVARAADVIRRAVMSQARITDDLLDLSRLRTGKLAINAMPLPWSAVVSRVADAIAADASAKSLSVLVDPGPIGLMVQADPVRVEQIVWNLVSNALKFTRPGGRIELRLAVDGDECRLDVIDDGQGIAPDFLEDVFGMFRQADRGTTREHGGMGIGLALVKHLAEEQGGHVAAASRGVGRGATFSVWLPLAGARAADPVVGAAPAPLAGRRLLVVDDSDDALEPFAALLRLEGAEVTAANSAGKALAALAQGSFDVLVSDVAMPEMDGYQLVGRVRADPRHAALPAIALTGFGRPQEVQRALDAGFHAHLVKPVAIDRLVETLHHLRVVELPPSANSV